MIKFFYAASIIGLTASFVLHVLVLIAFIFGVDCSIPSLVFIVLMTIGIICATSLFKESRYIDGFFKKIKQENKWWLYVLSIIIPIYCFAMIILVTILNKGGSSQIFYDSIKGTVFLVLWYCGIFISLYFKIKNKNIESHNL